MSEITDKWKNLRRDIGNLICAVDGKIEKIDAEEKRMEQKRDESYLNGTEDMRKAVNMLYDASNIGLTPQKMEDFFGTSYIPSIVSRFAAITVIDGLKQFLKERGQDFQVGDEIEIVDPTIISNGEKRIITKVGTNSIHLVDPATFNVTWIEKEHAKKTGKHYDAVPFSKDEEKILPWIYATDLAFFPSHSHGLYHYDWSHPNPVPTVLLQHFSIREGAEDGNRYRGPGIRHLPRIRN